MIDTDLALFLLWFIIGLLIVALGKIILILIKWKRESKYGGYAGSSTPLYEPEAIIPMSYYDRHNGD